MIELIFLLNLTTALLIVNKKYTWKDNLLLTIYSFKPFYSLIKIFFIALSAIVGQHYLYSILKDRVPLYAFNIIGIYLMILIIVECIKIIKNIKETIEINNILERYNKDLEGAKE